MTESSGGSNQLEQQIQAFMDRSNKRLQHIEEWYQSRFRTFHTSQNQYNFQRSESEQRVSGNPYAYHQYPGINPSFYRDSCGNFTGGFTNPTDRGLKYLYSPTSVYSYQVPYAYQIDNNNPSFYFVQFYDGSVVSMTATGLDSLLNLGAKYVETNCSQTDFQSLKAPLNSMGGIEMGYDYLETGHPPMEDGDSVMEHIENKEHQVFDKLQQPLALSNATTGFLKVKDEDVEEKKQEEDQMFDESSRTNKTLEISPNEIKTCDIRKVRKSHQHYKMKVLKFLKNKVCKVFDECPQRDEAKLQAEFWSTRRKNDVRNTGNRVLEVVKLSMGDSLKNFDVNNDGNFTLLELGGGGTPSADSLCTEGQPNFLASHFKGSFLLKCFMALNGDIKCELPDVGFPALGD
ncbi:hypothetical protein A4A49_20057 [Nicotiana attenuata]|uniref:Uncharacterized protein n=1 Tax=Nicotiana attenuata TaxID=49451 RepID=A0A314KY95_NICAT|nr:hypothetical protein A4A49_20057 [Nicotiana attenuata]